ncbi:hypothetical protein Ahy_B06g085228 isoform D [Arachis hypogaea]|uniref:Vesicle transport protein n=1 Tax=Arachis hypogaea TaxID=3818 RepID=A0A444YTV1_ARAHY|nr:hypothetical protein Ahy_B06g085228 isoform D [Arachis hypogaea]
MLLSMIVFAKPIKFALLFTFGNVLAVGSTAFLLGPAQQLGMMLDNARVFATAIYIGCVVIALICALWVSHTPLIIQSHFSNMLIILQTLIFLSIEQ